MTEIAEKLNNQAIILAEHGAYDDAIACLNRAVTLEQDNYLLWFNLGVTYRDAGKLHEAKLALEKAAEINPEDEDILDSLAVLCFLMEEFADALLIVRTDLSLIPIIRNFGILPESFTLISNNTTMPVMLLSVRLYSIRITMMQCLISGMLTTNSEISADIKNASEN